MIKYVKLNIQRFGHTNSTTNYELPQFIGTDKPQWLTDINQAFSAIDTAIHTVAVLANLNSNKIGDLTDLTTDSKIDVVSAINEVDSHTDSNTTTLASHTTAIASNSSHIGDITDLDTVDKSDLVNAINEVDLIAKNADTKIGNLSNLETVSKTNIVSAINEVDNNIKDFNLTVFKGYNLNTTSSEIIKSGVTSSYGIINVARNESGTIFKIYGDSIITSSSNTSYITLTNTGLTSVDEQFTISSAGVGQAYQENIHRCDLRYNTDGSITLVLNVSGTNVHRIYHPCLYFAKNFGDIPDND